MAKAKTTKKKQGGIACQPLIMRCATWNLKEEKGKLPYVVIWIGLHKLPSLMHFTTLEEAQAHANYLRKLGREPATLLDVNSMERIA